MNSEIYNSDYFDKFDGGKGYRDAVQWEDLAHILSEIFDNHFHVNDGSWAAIDVGCALGYLVKHLRRRNVETWGLDISEYAVNNAAPEIRQHIHQWDLVSEVTPPFGWSRFKLVTCMETLEHIPIELVDHAIQRLYNLIFPGGFIFLTICVEENPDHDADETHETIRPRYWWDQKIQSLTGMDPCPEIVKFIEGFSLFRNHRGVFVYRRPL